MKKLIKALAKYEGKKSQVHIGNLRESVRVLAALLACAQFDEDRDGIMLEWKEQLFKLEAKAWKLVYSNPEVTSDEIIKQLLGRKK